jgi:zinc-ribbon domain
MQCSNCGVRISSDDNFCRKCGRAVTIIDVPAVRGPAVPARVWQGARPAVARGVVLIAAGAVLRLLVGRAGKAILTRALSLGESSERRRFLPFPGARGTYDSGEELEILWYRRTRH